MPLSALVERGAAPGTPSDDDGACASIVDGDAVGAAPSDDHDIWALERIGVLFAVHGQVVPHVIAADLSIGRRICWGHDANVAAHSPSIAAGRSCR